MPEEIVSRILRLPGYRIYGWETDEATNTLTLSIRQTAAEPYYVCGGCGDGCRNSPPGGGLRASPVPRRPPREDDHPAINEECIRRQRH
jgi:hypothetical protein